MPKVSYYLKCKKAKNFTKKWQQNLKIAKMCPQRNHPNYSNKAKHKWRAKIQKSQK